MRAAGLWSEGCVSRLLGWAGLTWAAVVPTRHCAPLIVLGSALCLSHTTVWCINHIVFEPSIPNPQLNRIGLRNSKTAVLPTPAGCHRKSQQLSHAEKS